MVRSVITIIYDRYNNKIIISTNFPEKTAAEKNVTHYYLLREIFENYYFIIIAIVYNWWRQSQPLPLKNLFSKIGNSEVLENLFSKKIICDLLESHNFLKFGKKR